MRTLGYSLVYTAGFKEVETKGNQYAVARIPFSILRIVPTEALPIRVDVIVESETGRSSWRPDNPLTPRLILGSDNPADLGWLIFN